ncbi:MAG: cell division septation protein DedD [Bacteroidia bacterium]|jgi:cell division septation protein DedD
MPHSHVQDQAAMNHDQDDNTGFSDAEGNGLGQNPFDKSRLEQPDFDPFDDDTYEEPDRDTDHPGAYAEEQFQEEEEIDDLFPDNDLFEDDNTPSVPVKPAVSYDEQRSALDELEQLAEAHDLGVEDFEDPDFQDQDFEDPDFESPDQPDSDDISADSAAIVARRWDDSLDSDTDTPSSWQDGDDFLDEGDVDSPPWPMGLIAVAVLALILLIAGGYGVIQQRKATGDEIRQLRAELATATSQQDIDQSRSALQAMKARNSELQASMTALGRENRRLSDTVGGLEAQLDAQQSALAKAATINTSAAPKPAVMAPVPAAPAAKPATATSSVAAPIGDNSWFVNFGSYGQREAARSWVAKLNPASGETILIATQANGRTLYRVRVVGLSGRESAEQIARSLEQEYKLPKLWVGKQ